VPGTVNDSGNCSASFGVVIQAFRQPLGSTHGYAAMWPVIGVPVLLTFLLLRMLGPRR
jgi:hypothetical protein